ncbi:MAG TPA: ABC transporter permease [bacterium]|nr:ABC transporter permease [bacterium]
MILKFNICKKIIKLIATIFLSLFFVVSITFFLFEAIPGDLYDLDYIKNENVIINIRNKYGLDDPLFKRYLNTIKSFLIFDFGYSTINEGMSVKSIIKEKFPVSAIIGIFSIFFSLVFGIIIGLIKSKLLTKKRFLVLIIEILFISIPVFVLSILFQYFFCVKIKLFPVYWNNSFLSFFLPILVLSFYPIIFIERVLDSNVKKIKNSDYVAAAVVRGVSDDNIKLKYIIKNSLTAILSYIAPLTANLVVGSFVVESIFNIPGLGRYFITSVINRDYPVAMGLTIFFSILLIIVTTLFNFIILIIDYKGDIKDKKNER